MRQASAHTASGFQRKRRLSAHAGIVPTAVAVAAGAGLVLAYLMGTTWADAAADIAYWDARGTGSLGWMQQLGAVAVVWVEVGVLSLLAGIFVGAATPFQRRAGLALLIVVMTVFPLIGFGMATGLGGEQGFPEDAVIEGLLASALAATLGGFMGYGLGRAVRRRRSPGIA